jgi:hypothetical protein
VEVVEGLMVKLVGVCCFCCWVSVVVLDMIGRCVLVECVQEELMRSVEKVDVKVVF